MRCVNLGKITGVPWWYKIWLLHGCNRILVKENLLRRREGGFESCSSSPEARHESFALTRRWNLAKPVKISSGIIGRQNLIVLRQMVLQNGAVRRVKEGTSAVHLQSALDQKWCADSAEFYCFLRSVQDLIGRMAFGEPLSVPIIPSRLMVECHLISAKDQSRLDRKGHILVGDIEELEILDASVAIVAQVLHLWRPVNPWDRFATRAEGLGACSCAIFDRDVFVSTTSAACSLFRTDMTWTKSGTIFYSTSSGLHLRNIPYCSRKLLWTPKRTKEHIFQQDMVETFYVPVMYMATQSLVLFFALRDARRALCWMLSKVCHTQFPSARIFTLPHSILRFDLAGRDITEFLLTHAAHAPVVEYVAPTPAVTLQQLSTRYLLLCRVLHSSLWRTRHQIPR